MKKKRMPNPLGVALILLCLVMFSTVLISGLQARFVTRASGTDSARLASFAPKMEASPDAVTIAANSQSEYVITIRNKGETAVRYTAVVEFSGEDPEAESEKFDEGTEDAPKLSFTGELGPSEVAEETLTLDMSEYFDQMEDKWDTLSNKDVSGESGEIPFAVFVTFTQLD